MRPPGRVGSDGIAAIVLGRTEERARIEQVLDTVASGPTGVALEGAPGIGKTTLWRHAVESARGRGCRVLESAPAEPDAALAFAGLGDLFDPVGAQALAGLPDPQRRALAAALSLGEAEGAPSDPQALPRAVLRVLRDQSADRPLVVAIDDEQWLDRASARVLAFALCRVRTERICVLLARRPHTEAGLWSELSRGFREQGLDALVLPPLEMSAIDALVRSRLSGPVSRPLLHRLEEASGGNPLYAVAIAREVEAREAYFAGEHEMPIPRTLNEALAQRLRGLDSRSGEPLLVIAAMSQPTIATLKAVIAGFTISDLESAEQAGVIEIAGERVRFTHPLLASTHYAGVTGSRRRELHRRLAELIEDEEERAYHLALGAEAPDGGIASALEQASIVAARRGAPEVAAELLESAVRLTPVEAFEERWSRTIAAANHHYDSNLIPRARELLEALVPDLPHGPRRARALRLLAVSVMTSASNADLDAAQALLEEALADVGDDHGERAWIEQGLWMVLGNAGNPAATAGHARSAVGAAERAGDRGLLATMLGRLAWTEFWIGHGIQYEEIRRAMELEHHMPATSQHLPSMVYARMLLFSNDYAAARPPLERAVARARERGEQYDLDWLLLNLALLEWEAGNPDTAERYLSEAEDSVDHDDFHRAYVEQVQAAFAIDKGEFSVGRGLANASIRHAGGFALDVAFVKIRLAVIELWTGVPAVAHERLRPLRESLLSSGLGWMGNPVLGLWSYDIEALIATDHVDRADDVLADLDARAHASDNPHAIAIAHRCQGLLRAARGDIAGALEAIDAALLEHGRRPVPLEAGRTLLEKGALQRRAKQKAAAKKTLEEALTILEPLQAAMWVSRARDELGRVGLRRARVTNGLTPAQARVAELVAAGRSNNEIASTLFMSVRTVESHLTKVYREYGVRSRLQLAAAVAANAHSAGGKAANSSEDELATTR